MTAQELVDAVAACPDGGTVAFDRLMLDVPIVLRGRTLVSLIGGAIFWNGPGPGPVIELVSCTQCSIGLKLLENAGVQKTGVGVQITPEESSSISCVKNDFRIGLVQGFQTGYQVGVGNTKACDENHIHDGVVGSCVDGIRINGGNAQLQYIDRMRFGGLDNADVFVERGGAHLKNCTLSGAPYGVLIGESNPYVVLEDTYCEGTSMLYVASLYNSNSAGTLRIMGGGAYCSGPAGITCPGYTGDYPPLSIRWNHNAPLTIDGFNLNAPMLVEQGVVWGRGVNLTNPGITPPNYFYSRGNASYDVAGSQQQFDGSWKPWSYVGPGMKPATVS